MTRSDIIELANQYTERKGEKILSMPLIFSSICMDICKRGRHWWRKWDVQFNMTQGVTGYDLTAAANFTPNLQNVAVEEIMGITLILQAGPPLQTADLTPIFDRAGIIAIKNNPQQAQPSRYTIQPSTWSSILIDPPDATYLAEMTFWAMPNLQTDDSSNVVPVIPPWNHNVIVLGMEAAINKRVYGPNDARYKNAAASYEDAILTMVMRPQFTSNYTRQWIDDSQGSSQGGPIQSTSPNSP